MSKFNPGDIVRRVRGKTPMVMMTRHTVKYCGAPNISADNVAAYDLRLVTDPIKEFSQGWDRRMNLTERERLNAQMITSGKPSIFTETTMTKLYQTKEETPRFGTLLATNSAGLLVLEMKGTNEVLTFAKGAVEEVKPYTVRVRSVPDTMGKAYEYLSRKGDVAPGDLIFVRNSADMARVEAVDTKSDRATVELVGRKVVTEAFGDPVTE